MNQANWVYLLLIYFIPQALYSYDTHDITKKNSRYQQSRSAPAPAITQIKIIPKQRSRSKPTRKPAKFINKKTVDLSVIPKRIIFVALKESSTDLSLLDHWYLFADAAQSEFLVDKIATLCGQSESYDCPKNSASKFKDLHNFYSSLKEEEKTHRSGHLPIHNSREMAKDNFRRQKKIRDILDPYSETEIDNYNFQRDLKEKLLRSVIYYNKEISELSDISTEEHHRTCNSLLLPQLQTLKPKEIAYAIKEADFKLYSLVHPKSILVYGIQNRTSRALATMLANEQALINYIVFSIRRTKHWKIISKVWREVARELINFQDYFGAHAISRALDKSQGTKSNFIDPQAYEIIKLEFETRGIIPALHLEASLIQKRAALLVIEEESARKYIEDTTYLIDQFTKLKNNFAENRSVEAGELLSFLHQQVISKNLISLFEWQLRIREKEIKNYEKQVLSAPESIRAWDNWVRANNIQDKIKLLNKKSPDNLNCLAKFYNLWKPENRFKDGGNINLWSGIQKETQILLTDLVMLYCNKLNLKHK